MSAPELQHSQPPSSSSTSSGASPTQVSLPDIKLNVPGMPTRLRNVLRFVAGLTKFEGISLALLRPLVLKSLPDNRKHKEMSLNSLHWLFETQCSDIYNELVSVCCLITENSSDKLPLDFFVLGYAMAHISSHWEITLSEGEIGDEEIEMLVAGVNFKANKSNRFDKSRTLQRLNVSKNSISDRGVTTLAEMLRENRTLQQLNVSTNFIGDEGATALAEMLKKNRTLQQLDISSNCIGQVGAIALAEMLKENGTLQQLDISSNCIGDRGATALAEMLKTNKTLQQLNIRNNYIGTRGVMALADNLKENRTLQQLEVKNNYIGTRVAMKVAEILKENGTLQLDVRDNARGNTKVFKQDNGT